MLKFIDRFLNQITMYRLVLYFLLILLGIAMVLGFFGLVPYSPWAILFSVAWITAVGWLVNFVFAKVYDAPLNVESVYITALILALIISPPSSLHDTVYWSLATWATVWAMASKYILTINRKHIFNPAAIGVAVTALALGQSATWWVATPWLFPFVLIGSWLIVQKILRWDLVWSFITVALTVILVSHFGGNSSLLTVLNQALLRSPIIFLAGVMLTEPLTTPPTRTLRGIYGTIVGLLMAPFVHFGSLYFTPELALLVGNLFSYIASPKTKLVLRLREKIKVSPDVYDLVFSLKSNFHFRSGQYLEWTLAHPHPDSRGNRRYFTIASAPEDRELRIGVRDAENASSFKQALLGMRQGDIIVASQLAGDFTLPNDTSKPLVFIAGGIGVTPFRSMVMSMINRKTKRPIVMFYSNKTVDDIAYHDVFDEATRLKLGLKTIYAVTDVASIPADWSGHRGRVTPELIQQEVPNYRTALFYLSGPHSMVVNFETTLKQLGVPANHVKVDYFPGFV